MARAKTALVLAGHGSHISPNTAGLIWQYVDVLRAQGVADEITAAFWKEPPFFHTALHSLAATDITIVPIFTASGYFTQTVLPTEIGLQGALTQQGARTIRQTLPLGTHPQIRTLVETRVREALTLYKLNPAEVTIALIGHSTRRNPTSRAATEAHAQHLRALYPQAQVEAIYLDDDPSIPTIYDSAKHPTIIAVPYFLAAGSHTTQDVPTALGLQPRAKQGQVSGRQVYYTPPLGVGTELVEAILALAHEAGMPVAPASPEPSPWNHFPSVGCDLLWKTVQQQELMRFGQLQISPRKVIAYTLGDMDTASILATPAQIRRVARESPFRPLSYPIPGGWMAKAGSAEKLHAIVETIYPGAVADWAASQQGTFAAESLDSTLTRQTGQYRPLMGMSQQEQNAVCALVCRACVRAPTWASQLSDKAIPCREACNVWLSAAVGRR